MALPAENQYKNYLTVEEYFALEEELGEKFEYVSGEIFAMTGGSINHALIGKNMAIALDSSYRGKPCIVFNADAKLRLSEAENYFYPDAMVVCEEGKIDAQYVESPRIIVEVLSPSTEDYDHGKKFAYYRQIASVQIYIMIHQSDVLVEMYQRRSDNSWVLKEYTDLTDHIALEEGVQLTLQDLYRDVTFHQ